MQQELSGKNEESKIGITVLKNNSTPMNVFNNEKIYELDISPEEEHSAEVDCYFANDMNPPIDDDGELLDRPKTIDDYLVNDFGIFKLTPKECGRLMNVADEDIEKILSVNSNSQAYKQFGNSIVVAVLIAIFSQLNFKGIKPWNELTEDERYELIYKGCVLNECEEE